MRARVQEGIYGYCIQLLAAHAEGGHQVRRAEGGGDGGSTGHHYSLARLTLAIPVCACVPQLYACMRILSLFVIKDVHHRPTWSCPSYPPARLAGGERTRSQASGGAAGAALLEVNYSIIKMNWKAILQTLLSVVATVLCLFATVFNYWVEVRLRCACSSVFMWYSECVGVAACKPCSRLLLGGFAHLLVCLPAWPPFRILCACTAVSCLNHMSHTDSVCALYCRPSPGC